MESERIDFAPPSPEHHLHYRTFHEHFPYYLSMGMTYEDYWERDCQLVKAYRKASDLHRDRLNTEHWLQGAYIYEALCNVSPILHAFAKSGTKPIPYPDKPYALTKEEIEEERRQARIRSKRIAFENWANQLNLPDTKNEDTDE